MNLDYQLNKETVLARPNKLRIIQIVVYDQFSDDFKQLIKKNSSTDQICGFTSVANIRILNQFGKEEGLQKIEQKQLVYQYIDEMMKYILNSRLKYALSQDELKKDKQKFKQYCSDLIANYELSDYLKTLNLDNVYFYRNCALYQQHIKLFEQTKYEERERIIKDETLFQNDPYFIYYPKEDKYIKKQDFKSSEQHLYIFDTMGHYLCGYIQQGQSKKKVTILETIPFRDSKQSEILWRFFE